MTKRERIFIGIIVGMAVGLAVLVFAQQKNQLEEGNLPIYRNKPEVDYCVQVITKARNTKTGEVKEFGTPCDIPKGWEVVENDEQPTASDEQNLIE